jgi:hypothetical protein
MKRGHMNDLVREKVIIKMHLQDVGGRHGLA